jgi:DNA-binding PadR family transcriptional regulator
VTNLAFNILDEMNKKIIQSFLDFLVLMELKRHPLGCYDVVSIIQNRHHVSLSPSTVYTCLYTLEKDGLVKSELNSTKRVFMLTDFGKETVKEFWDSKTKIIGLLLNLFG